MCLGHLNQVLALALILINIGLRFNQIEIEQFWNLIKLSQLLQNFFLLYIREKQSLKSPIKIGQLTVNKNIKLRVVMISERTSLRTQSFL